MRAGVPVRGLCDLGHRACGIHRGRIDAALRPVLLPCRIGAVEVAFQVFNRQDRIPGRWPRTPFGIPVAPVRKGNVAWRCGNGTGHGIHEDTVGVKVDCSRGPIKTIFVEALGGSKVQLVDLEGAGIGSVEACLFGFGRLEDEVDGLGGVIEFGGEELHVDFLCVVEIL